MKISITFYFIVLISLFGNAQKDTTEKRLSFKDMDKAGELYQEAKDLYYSKNYKESAEKYAASFVLLGTNKKAAYNAACSYSLANMKDEAIKYAREAMKLGMFDFEEDHDFDNIKETSEFQDLVFEAQARKQIMASQSIKPKIILPANYNISHAYPLIVAFHGFGSSPDDMAEFYEDIALENNCILLLCRGTKVIGENSFAWSFEQEEYERVSDEIDITILKYSIDKKKVIVTGFAQGGFMCYAFGMVYSDKFIGMIPVAGSMPTNLSAKNMKNHKLKIFAMVGLRDNQQTVQQNSDAQKVFSEAHVPFKLYTYDKGHEYPENRKEVLNNALNWILNE